MARWSMACARARRLAADRFVARAATSPRAMTPRSTPCAMPRRMAAARSPRSKRVPRARPASPRSRSATTPCSAITSRCSARHADRLMAPDSGFTHRQTLAGVVRFNSPELHEEASRVDRGRRPCAGRRGRPCRRAGGARARLGAPIAATADALARIDVAAGHAAARGRGRLVPAAARRRSPASRSKAAAIRWSRRRSRQRRALRRQRSARWVRATGCG